MGHGNSNKLYITHAEHSGMFGSHSSSKGFRAKREASHTSTITPFDCCALSFQPFSDPVCARNTDGTGHVFDLVNIIPWLKQHNNTHPITKDSLKADDLITLHYSRKEATGEIHDPISFKPFSEHSHIIAIATTGNVFLMESIKGGRDLLADIPFKKTDIITLQNPHGLPIASVPIKLEGTATKPSNTVAAISTSSGTVAATTVNKPRNPVPWNISPYSTGLPGASLTSTSVDPQLSSSKLVWDEEELMFEALSAPVKGKEKDVGKRRAYVRVVTSLGGRSLNLELFCEKAPKTCYNFLMLAKQGKYDNCLFHRLVPGFMIQTGDPTGTGAGGESYWGTPFRDEHDLRNAAKHDSRGVVAMANKGANTNGSQFYLTFRDTPHLDKKHTVFGKLVGGEDVLDVLEKVPLKDGTERPAKSISVTEVIIYQDPFEEYKTRLAKKIARRAEQSDGPSKPAERKDDVNWFGVKVGMATTTTGDTQKVPSGEGGVGKYLTAVRPASAMLSGPADRPAKKRKTGFGAFEGW